MPDTGFGAALMVSGTSKRARPVIGASGIGSTSALRAADSAATAGCAPGADCGAAGRTVSAARCWGGAAGEARADSTLSTRACSRCRSRSSASIRALALPIFTSATTNSSGTVSTARPNRIRIPVKSSIRSRPHAASPHDPPLLACPGRTPLQPSPSQHELQPAPRRVALRAAPGIASRYSLSAHTARSMAPIVQRWALRADPAAPRLSMQIPARTGHRPGGRIPRHQLQDGTNDVIVVSGLEGRCGIPDAPTRVADSDRRRPNTALLPWQRVTVCVVMAQRIFCRLGCS